MRIVVCGATGSVGQQVIVIAQRLGMTIAGISYHTQIQTGQMLAQQVKAPFHYCSSQVQAGNVASYEALFNQAKPNLVVNAVVGAAGLAISALSVQKKLDLALANKESLVIAGYWLMKAAKANKVRIYPIDSEHAALFTLLHDVARRDVAQAFITASGGPFWNTPRDEWKTIRVTEAINHPTWRMGKKISVDSATLANKAFELIEAYHLFGIKNIIAYQHPHSLVHAGILLRDGSYRLAASTPDMRLPIAQALSRFKPSRFAVIKQLDLTKNALVFNNIDEQQWPLLAIAHECIKKPQTTRGLVLVAANDFAVSRFLKQQLRFDQITPLVTNYWKQYAHRKLTGLTALYATLSAIEADLSAHWKRYLGTH